MTANVILKVVNIYNFETVCQICAKLCMKTPIHNDGRQLRKNYIMFIRVKSSW